MEVLERRMEKCEDRIDKLSIGVAENATNMGHIQKIVDDFSKYIERSIATLTKIDLRIESLDTNQKRFEKKLGEIECKVDQNEEAHKIDTRPIFKSVVTKIIIAVVIFSLGLGLLYQLLT